MKKLETFEDACKIEGLDPSKVIPDFDGFPEKERKSMQAHAQLVIIVKAANRLENNGKEWVPNWDHANEPKYEIWFEKSSSGFRFDVCVRWATRSRVGSRLCFKSWELAEKIANQFEALYNDYLL